MLNADPKPSRSTIPRRSTLNEAKTSLKDVRRERFDFPGYTFGPHWRRRHGKRYLGYSPSKKSIGRIKNKIGDLLVPGNMGSLRDQLNRLLRGWLGYFRHGALTAAYRDVEGHVSSANSASAASSGHCRRRSRGPDTKPVGEPDAANPQVRFDERGEETGHWPLANVNAPLLDSTVRGASERLISTAAAKAREPLTQNAQCSQCLPSTCVSFAAQRGRACRFSAVQCVRVG